jgi:DNA-directed RNA polymerase subunit M/transcription elongation factor TFIIS
VNWCPRCNSFLESTYEDSYVAGRFWRRCDTCGYKTSFVHRQEAQMKIPNKYYVAADQIADGDRRNWTKATEAEAVEHARQLLEENPNRQRCFVVKIIKVIRRAKQPVVVETVS